MKKRGRKPGNGAPRKSCDDYGITKERYFELKKFCEKTDETLLLMQISEEASGYIHEYIFYSVRFGKTFEEIEYLGLHRIPCGRTDFYGYRRYFYHLLNEELKKKGETK